MRNADGKWENCTRFSYLETKAEVVPFSVSVQRNWDLIPFQVEWKEHVCQTKIAQIG